MNVVIFGKGFGKPRQMNLSGSTAVAAAFAIAGSLCCAAFAGGYWYSAQNESGPGSNELRDRKSVV